jgi:hypothetical protein
MSERGREGETRMTLAFVEAQRDHDDHIGWRKQEFEFGWYDWNIFAQEKEGTFIFAYAKHFAAFDGTGGLGFLFFYCWKQILSELN